MNGTQLIYKHDVIKQTNFCGQLNQNDRDLDNDTLMCFCNSSDFVESLNRISSQKLDSHFYIATPVEFIHGNLQSTLWKLLFDSTLYFLSKLTIFNDSIRNESSDDSFVWKVIVDDCNRCLKKRTFIRVPNIKVTKAICFE